jgi:ribA/ribD-fused uncharacterized protein
VSLPQGTAQPILPFLKGFMSQWSRSDFALDGEFFVCAEQYMMWRKAHLFGDVEMAGKILIARDPHDHKRIGQAVRNFDQQLWDANKVDIVTAGTRAKFGQNAGIARKLLATGSATLVEANPKDFIWGVGLSEDDPDIQDPAKWRGQNLLGEILMQVRAELRAG